MFDNRLHNHTLTNIDAATGRTSSRRVTCFEAEAFHGPHTAVAEQPDGTRTYEVIDCRAAEQSRLYLSHRVETLDAEVQRQKGTIADLTAEVANYRRLIAGAMQIVFRMGPALQSLLAEDLEAPGLTDDGTAVKLTNVLFTVVIDALHEEQITMHAVTGGVPDLTVSIADGRISEHDRTLLLGHAQRIRTAAAVNGVDPALAGINLIGAAAAQVQQDA